MSARALTINLALRRIAMEENAHLPIGTSSYHVGAQFAQLVCNRRTRGSLQPRGRRPSPFGCWCMKYYQLLLLLMSIVFLFLCQSISTLTRRTLWNYFRVLLAVGRLSSFHFALPLTLLCLLLLWLLDGMRSRIKSLISWTKPCLPVCDSEQPSSPGYATSIMAEG
jgi:hypothetical protein